MDSYLLEGLTPEGKAPKTRIPDALDAQRIFERLFDAYNGGRGVVNAKVAGAINGEAPRSQAALDAEGLGWTSNVNFRLLEADVNQAQNPYYMLFADVSTYATIRVKMPNTSDQINNIVGQIISEEHTRLCNKDRQNFDHQMQLSIANMNKFGSGPIYFPNKKDFRFKAAPNGFVFVPDETTQQLDELPLLYIYQEWDITTLYNAIQTPKASEAGWDVALVKTLLINWCNANSGYTRSRSWEYWQDKIREHDVYFSSAVEKIKTTWGYVREFNGKITRFLITAQQGMGYKDFLYRKDNEYENWDQIIHPFFGEIGNGNWNGVKGIGIKAFNFRDAQNKLKNRLMDAAMAGSQLMFGAKDERALEAFQNVQMGPYSVFNSELTPLQFNFATVLDKPMAVDRQLEYDLRNNIGGLRQRLGDPQSVQPVSAKQAGIDSMSDAQLTQSATTMWLRQMDCLYTEQVNRMKEKPRVPSNINPFNKWEELLNEFHEACEERGVPKEAFKHIKEVKATRSIGRGSEIAKQQIALQVYGILRSDPNVPQQVVVNHLRNMISNQTGPEYLEMIWPFENLSVFPSLDQSKAQDENAGMLLGVQPIFSPEQNPLAHATTHLQFWGQQLQQVQQGADPGSYLRFASVCDPHVQQTLQSLQGERTSGSMYQKLFNAWQQLMNETKAIAQRFAEAQQAQAQQQQEAAAMQQQALLTGQMLDPESQVEMARVQADSQIKLAETQADNQRKNIKLQGDMRRKNVQTTQQLRINAAKTLQEIKSKNAKAKTDRSS